jgi:hypothetical protein
MKMKGFRRKGRTRNKKRLFKRNREGLGNKSLLYIARNKEKVERKKSESA